MYKQPVDYMRERPSEREAMLRGIELAKGLKAPTVL